MKACNSRVLSRKEFAALGALGLTGKATVQATPLTAGQVVERIKAHLGVPWRGGPTDTFKSGAEESKVTGIATTVMSTFDVIKRAAASGKNMMVTHALGWDKYVSNDDPRVYVLPHVRLRDLAKDVEKRLHLHAMRVVGDPESRVSRAALLQGTPPFHASTVLPKVDVVVAGEQKGMILIGHWVSEDQGMRVCADWLKTFISEVPVQWISAGDSFWRP